MAEKEQKPSAGATWAARAMSASDATGTPRTIERDAATVQRAIDSETRQLAEQRDELLTVLERIGIGEEFDDLEPSDGLHRRSARRLARDTAARIRNANTQPPEPTR